MRYAIAAVLALAAVTLLPACAGNDTRSDEDKALLRERAAEERGRREAEDEARRREATQQQRRRAPTGVDPGELPEPPAVGLPSGLPR
ncbi:MAG: hypothetical protein WC809_04755 [Sinimarinibacterium sp.]|jgi:hypothetical protein